MMRFVLWACISLVFLTICSTLPHVAEAAQDVKSITNEDRQQIARLSKTLQDPVERQKLLVQLHALETASSNKNSFADDDGILAVIPENVSDVVEDITIGKTAFVDLMRQIHTLQHHIMEPRWRAKILAEILRGLLEMLIILVLAWMVRQILQAILRRLFRPGYGLKLIKRLVDSILLLVTIVLVCRVWGADSIVWVVSSVGNRFGLVVLVAAASLSAWEWLNYLVDHFLTSTDHHGIAVERSARVMTLLPFFRNAMMTLLLILFGIALLGAFGVDVAPLVAGAGVVGVAIGFGAQKLVQDMITGAFILFEDSIAVGDVINVSNHSGVVEGLTIRTVRLRDVNGQLHTIPFSSITMISNQSRDYGYHLFEITVSFDNDMEKAQAIVRQVADETGRQIPLVGEGPDPVEWYGIDKISASGAVIAGRIRSLPGRQAVVARFFNQLLLQRFKEEGITFATLSLQTAIVKGSA